MQKDTFETTEQLQNRLKEIEDLIKVVSEEKQEIQEKLTLRDFKSKKLCVSNDSIVENRKEEDEKEVEIKIEDDSSKKSANAINNEKKLREEKYQRMTNLDSLKQYFEEDWDIDISQYSQYTALEQEGSEFEKKARLKTFYFLIGEYIDFFDEQIEKAALTKEQFDLPPEQLKLVAEPFFDALITRSKVIDLYEKCAIKSGRLSQTTSLGISEIQTASVRCYYLLNKLYYFLDYQDRFDWDYEKIKGVFYFWEGGFASSEGIDEDCTVSSFSYKLRKILKNDKIKLTEEEKKALLLILNAVEDLVENGWWDQRYRNTEKKSK